MNSSENQSLIMVRELASKIVTLPQENLNKKYFFNTLSLQDIGFRVGIDSVSLLPTRTVYPRTLNNGFILKFPEDFPNRQTPD